MKLDIISRNVSAEERTQRGTYKATITVGGAFIDFEGVYELTATALVTQTIESRLRYQAHIDIALQPAPESKTE